MCNMEMDAYVLKSMGEREGCVEWRKWIALDPWLSQVSYYCGSFRRGGRDDKGKV